jgi:hypothetical protein
VCGERVDDATLAAVTGLPPEELLRQLGELERAGFLAFDGARYRFGAEMVRLFLTSMMLAGGERKRLHERVVRALAAAGVTGTLGYAEQLYGAGSWSDAAALAGRVADAAREAGNVRLAERAARLRAKAAQRAQAG